MAEEERRMPLADALRAARARRGWSREALAYHSGVSYAAIAQIEAGRRTDVRIRSLVALADALGVSIDFLVGRSRSVCPLQHRGLTYGADDEFVAAMAPFLAEGARHGDRLLAVTTAANIDLLRGALGAAADDVDFVDAVEWYLSPAVALDRYRRYVDEGVAKGYPWVRVIGEPVWRGRNAHEVLAWTRYESFINASLSSAPATIVCPYDTRTVPESVVADAQRTHPEMVDGGGVRPSPRYVDTGQFLFADERP